MKQSCVWYKAGEWQPGSRGAPPAPSPCCPPAPRLQFCQCPPAVARLRPHQADDMLFFVHTEETAVAARTRLFVRRRQRGVQALPADLQPAGTEVQGGGPGGGAAGGAGKAAQVDWRASVLLMVVLQTAYRLSLLTAGDAELLNAFVDDAGPPRPGGAPGGSSSALDAAGGSSSSSLSSAAAAAASARVHQVTKVVHASPRWVLCLRQDASVPCLVAPACALQLPRLFAAWLTLPLPPVASPAPWTRPRRVQPRAGEPGPEPLGCGAAAGLVPRHLLRCGLV